MTKRTKTIAKHHFRKTIFSFKTAPLALALSAAFLLSGCEKADHSTLPVKNQHTQIKTEQPQQPENTPKFTSLEACEIEYGKSKCTFVADDATTSNTQASHSTGSFMPLMTGMMLGHMMSRGSAFNTQQSNTNQSQFTNSTTNNKADLNKPKQSNSFTSNSTSAQTPQATSKTVTRSGFGSSTPSRMSSGG